MTEEMKKGKLRIISDCCILICILILIDITIGFLGNKYAIWLNKVPRQSDAALVNYNMNAAVPDVAIIGSSTAICHYVPSIIHDSLLMETGCDYEVFNMGMSRQKMAYNYYALKSLIERKKPVIVIEDVWASNLSVSDHPHYFEELRPYVNSNHNVRDLLEHHNEYSFMMKSNLYCYNTELVKMIMSLSKPQNANGYRPSNVEMKEIKKEYERDTSNIHPESVAEFDAMIDLCKANRITLFVVLSPAIHASDTTSSSYVYMKEKCLENNIPFLDYSNDEQFYQQQLFSDPLHMNSKGAELFSRVLMKDIVYYLIK